MTDDLRTRIAAIAQNHVRCDACTFARTPTERYLHFSDAVIRELGLEPETRIGPVTADEGNHP